ncbi:MAG: hypothetical protein WBI63_07415 [Coriobacteriia bacterium]
MKKGTLVLIAAVIALGVAAYFGVGYLVSPGDSAVAGAAGNGTGATADPNQPDRTAEVKGTVVSVDGTVVVIDRLIVDPSEELSDEEKAAKKAERASMSMEERQALKAAEQADVPVERVSVEVPVGVRIVKMILEGDTSVAQAASLGDLKAGANVTIWTDGPTDGGTAEYVKIQSGN